MCRRALQPSLKIGALACPDLAPAAAASGRKPYPEPAIGGGCCLPDAKACWKDGGAMKDEAAAATPPMGAFDDESPDPESVGIDIGPGGACNRAGPAGPPPTRKLLPPAPPERAPAAGGRRESALNSSPNSMFCPPCGRRLSRGGPGMGRAAGSSTPAFCCWRSSCGGPSGHTESAAIRALPRALAGRLPPPPAKIDALPGLLPILPCMPPCAAALALGAAAPAPGLLGLRYLAMVSGVASRMSILRCAMLRSWFAPSFMLERLHTVRCAGHAQRFEVVGGFVPKRLELLCATLNGIHTQADLSRGESFFFPVYTSVPKSKPPVRFS